MHRFVKIKLNNNNCLQSKSSNYMTNTRTSKERLSLEMLKFSLYFSGGCIFNLKFFYLTYTDTGHRKHYQPLHVQNNNSSCNVHVHLPGRVREVPLQIVSHKYFIMFPCSLQYMIFLFPCCHYKHCSLETPGRPSILHEVKVLYILTPCKVIQESRI